MTDLAYHTQYKLR